jgi:hypothetical protein
MQFLLLRGVLAKAEATLLSGSFLKNYGVEVAFNGMTSLLNFIKFCQLVQKLIGDRQTDSVMVSLACIFLLGRKGG